MYVYDSFKKTIRSKHGWSCGPGLISSSLCLRQHDFSHVYQAAAVDLPSEIQMALLFYMFLHV